MGKLKMAWNSNTPIETLTKLSADENKWIRSGVVWNPSTPIELLIKLSEDEDEFVACLIDGLMSCKEQNSCCKPGKRKDS